MPDQKIDNLYASPMGNVKSFKFDEKVVGVFPDMINRSVPGYSSIVATIGMLAKHYSQPKSYCIDLGCSLGASMFAMVEAINDKSVSFIGIDNSQAMIDHCSKVLSDYPSENQIELRQEDILNTEISNASVVVLNFTLQFISPEDRNRLISDIYQGLKPGGALILSEKVVFENDELQTLFTGLHHDFKRANGYSDLEISQKRAAIEDVLVPETLSIHHERLSQAGFASSAVWFQCFNFASLVAVK